MYSLKNIAEITSNNRKEINEFLELFCNESSSAIEFLSFKLISEKVNFLTLGLEQVIHEIRSKELLQE